jgi:hypothetical protein
MQPKQCNWSNYGSAGASIMIGKAVGFGSKDAGFIVKTEQ